MKNSKFLLFAAIAALVSLQGFSQVTKDSINLLKQQKQSLSLSSKINERKLQLAKLENNLEKKSREVETTTEDARRAADENAEAAAKLTSDPQDKSLAKRAEKAGNNAKKNAKRARVAADNLADLKKDIESLRNKIADDEAKLAANPVQP